MMKQKKRRRLRKPIRLAVKVLLYILMGMAVDLGTICTSLVCAERTVWTVIISICMMLNVGLWYLFFRDEVLSRRQER